MPLYMDIHRGIHATADDVQAAHLSDLEAQERFGVRYLKYWFNRGAGTVCCLVDAPDPESARQCHIEAHGLVPEKMIEVEDEVVQAFLGGSADAGTGRMVDDTGSSDGGLRTVLFTDIVGSTELTQRLGDAEAMKVLRVHDMIVRREIEARRGQVIKHTGDGTMAAFPTASTAIEASMAIQRAFTAHNQRMPDRNIEIRIGMSAGEPVDEGQDLFGATVQLARRVCDAAGVGGIYVSNVVRELCLGKDFRFADMGETPLKGFADPVRLHEVVWRVTAPDGDSATPSR
ncbi:MAG TPA: nickel-binding protein [Gemmatimonadota bacterium]|nr:nickel-binding protein [Gemmatimonadota bacterium]